jgi:hypothetical protein
VLEQVDDLRGGLAEVRRVMKRRAPMVVFTTFATERFDEHDEDLMRRHLGYVDGNLDRTTVEETFHRVGLEVERVNEVGSEWREHAEEQTQPVSRAMLRLSRLRRRRDEIVALHGQETFDHIEANLHWELFQFLGKLLPVVYVLRAA